MAADEVSVYNMALNAIGTRDNVSSPSEGSREAEVCRLWFGPVRDQVLRAAPWPCAKAHSRLALLAQRDDTLAWTSDDPDPGFQYAYAAPSDMLNPQYITDFSRFTLSTYKDQMTLMTNTVDPVLAYTKSQILIPLWDIGLLMAISAALASYICMPLTGKPARAKKAQDDANGLIMQARMQSANDDNNTFETMPDWITARGYAWNAPETRFYFPNGPMISVTEAAGVS